MAWCELHYRSAALVKHVAANVILPDDPALSPPYPVMYLLHGLSDDYTIWMRRTSIERYMDGIPMIVVMPDGGRGFYTDAVEGYAYESAIISDLIPLVDRTFPTIVRRAGRCIGGLSMGGYGALRLALSRPDMFCSAVSHSGAVFFGNHELSIADDRAAEFRRILGDAPRGGRNDLFALAERLDRNLMPALRLDCGTDDHLLEANRSFHAHLEALEIPHEYEEFPGGHDWSYWDTHVPEAIRFHLRAMAGAT